MAEFYEIFIDLARVANNSEFQPIVHCLEFSFYRST